MPIAKVAVLGTLVLAGWFAAYPVATEQPRKAVPPKKAAVARQILLSCKLVEPDADGKPKIVARPQLVTVEGRPAEFLAGGQLGVPDVVAGAGKQQLIDFGVRVRFVASGTNDGRICVDATVELVNPDKPRNGLTVVNSTSTRVLGNVRPGEELKVDCGKGRQMVMKVQFAN